MDGHLYPVRVPGGSVPIPRYKYEQNTVFWYVRDKWMRKVVKRHDRFRRDTCTCIYVRVLLRVQVAVMEGELRRLER
jgi:hypothetical protein